MLERLLEVTVMKPSRSYHQELIEDLKDPAEASAYLNASLEAGDQSAFLLVLRNVLEARGNMTKIARDSKSIA